MPRQAGPSRSAHGEAGPTGHVPAAGPVAPSGPVPPSESVPAGEPYGDTLPGPASDAELIARVRRGDDSAYEELYRRHADSVRRYARSCCRDAHTAEDLTGEVFARTLQAVRGGRGPDVAVRAYLLTTVRRVAAAWGKTAKREQLVEDFAVFAATAAGAAASSPAGGSGTESESADVRAMAEADQTMAVRAFRSLPERWQAVLWHTAVEQESPSEVAPLLGLTANATAVLAHRAREGLRQAYLQAHVSEALTGQEECGRYADRLGAHARGALRLRADRELRKHLEGCDRCRAASVELADVNACLRGLLPAAFVGWFGAAYAAKAAAGAGAGAVAAAGAAAGAGAGASGGGGAAGGGALAEGLGMPAKVAVGAGLVLAAAAAVAAAMTLTAGDGSPAPEAKAEPRVSAPAPAPPAAPPGKPAPKPERPGAAAEEPAAPAPATAKPSASAPAASEPPAKAPAPAQSRTPGSPRPSPSTTGQPDPDPDPEPEPEPEPVVFPVNGLAWGGIGGAADEPMVRIAESGFIWQRSSVRIGGETFRDGGVTVYPPSTIVIDLNRSCSSFEAEVGIDDLSTGRGTIRFEVYGDGTRLYRSRPMNAGQEAQTIRVGIGGRETVRLVAEAPGATHLGRLADWAHARFSC